MRLGIDLGTSRTVVAIADRGNYPVVGFLDEAGDAHEHYPSVTALVDGELIHGLDAVRARREGAASIASWKRLLGLGGTDARVELGGESIALLDLATSYVKALRRDLFERSNLKKAKKEGELEAVIAVPANAHSTQRFITLEAFRRAGFHVRAMLNEPSAAGLEYAHRYRDTLSSRREHVVVYDLGGGTFDAALVRMAAGRHDVLATGGVGRLGGDDFDEALLELAIDIGKLDRDFANGAVMRARLLEECRAAKEALNPSSKRIVLDFVGLGPRAPEEPIVVPVGDYYERVRPLVLRSIDALAPVLARAAGEETDAPNAGEKEIAGLYVVGGASGLPIVPRVLRERFARRVHRSPYPSAATAIGLAIAAASEGETEVAERFTRHLGVFREQDGGKEIAFDGIFEKGTPMPSTGGGPLVVTRRYHAQHNVGHYRFVECGDLDAAGAPTGDITPHADVLFPFAPELRARWDLAKAKIERLDREGPLIEERYEVDAAGILAVTITDVGASYARRYVL